jgi:ubiquinone/menaquinone biosynthesis C-methylase UbiE
LNYHRNVVASSATTLPRRLEPGEKVVDAGSGAGFDCFVAAGQVGPAGRVVGIDMLPEMLAKSRESARRMALDNVEFREGLLERMPVEDGWADVVISNGVINLCADKKRVFGEIWRVLRPGGWLQFADIANGKPEEIGFAEVRTGPPCDTFRDASGEKKARQFEVYGYPFIARKPG